MAKVRSDLVRIRSGYQALSKYRQPGSGNTGSTGTVSMVPVKATRLACVLLCFGLPSFFGLVGCGGQVASDRQRLVPDLLALSEQYADGSVFTVRHGEIGITISIEVACGDRHWTGVRDIRRLRAETAAPIIGQHSHVVGTAVGHGKCPSSRLRSSHPPLQTSEPRRSNRRRAAQRCRPPHSAAR